MDANFAKSLKSIPEQNVRPLALKTIARHFPYVERYWKHSPISLNNIHKSKLCALEEKQRCTVENIVETSVRRFISSNLFKNMEFGAACAVLTPCENSHPFEHRRVALCDEPVKIGRSLAKLQASSNNFVFDCKVLSRNHALIWYEDGSFYVKDTKSSNGTFINGQRLSKASEESLPKEVFSGDLIQLGVEIVENTRNGTSFSHGCIVAMLRLYHPNGLEALPRETTDSSMTNLVSAYNIDASQAISNQELFQVQQYIRVREAVYREKIMESKMTALQALLVTTQDATNECWNALIDEDRLLSRIEMLESQLRICNKNIPESQLRNQLLSLTDEKEKYENAAKEAIRRVMQEKLDALQRLGDVEQCLESTVKQCGQLRDDYEAVQKELALVTEQHNECLKRVHDLNKDLEAYIFNESSYFCMFGEAELKCQLLEAQVHLVVKQENEINEKVKMEPDKALANRDKIVPSSAIVSKENLKDTKELNKESTELLLSNDSHVIKKLKSELIDQDSSSENVKQNRDANLNSSNTSVAKCEVEHTLEPNSFADALEFSRKQAQDLTEDLRKAKLELENSQQKALHLEEQLLASNDRLSFLVEQAVSDIMARFENVVYQKFKNEELVAFLKDQVCQLESSFKQTLYSKNFHENAFPNGHSSDHELEDEINGQGDETKAHCAGCTELLAQISDLTFVCDKNECIIGKYKMKLADHERICRRAVESNQQLVDQLRRNEKDLQSVYTQMMCIQGMLTSDDQRSNSLLKDCLRSINNIFKESLKEIDHHADVAEEVLGEWNLLSIASSLDGADGCTDTFSVEDKNNAPQPQLSCNEAEFASLKHECSNLRQRIAAVEKEVKLSAQENSLLQTRYAELLKSYNAVHEEKTVLDEEKSSWLAQLIAANQEANLLRLQLNETQNHQGVMDVSDVIASNEENILFPSERSSIIKEQSCQCEELGGYLGLCSFFTLLQCIILIVGVVMALLPWFSSLTATLDNM
ncbi:Sarcolemmal membrane-associated protein [Trichinella nativa]|uniref:Sarcolemmal membrane-associated protein n=1 Tax=Trichinella nativa TaxID=6335 RepID=A0A0V1LTG5_9BILA|nr:Sarcolemmal membrane-associated protein [Trichinella nativa]